MGKLHIDWKQNMIVSDELSDYCIRLTPGWAESLDDAAAKASPGLMQIVCDFVLAIRSAQITASLPHGAIEQFQNFVDRYTSRDNSEPVAKAAEKLMGKVNELRHG